MATTAIAPFGFTGELQHGSDGWLRARWYGAGRGSFGGRDPYQGDAGVPYSMQYYQYGYSAPTVWTDPSGEKPCAMPTQTGGQCGDGGSISFPPPPPPGPSPWQALASGLKEGIAHGLAHELVCLLQEGLDALTAPAAPPIAPPTHPTPDDESKQIVIELGSGSDPTNLIALTHRFPLAQVYGVEKQAGNAYMLKQHLAFLGSPVQVIEDEYDLYAGPLRNQADVVVAVAPNPAAPIAEGIRNFVKSGGTVLVLTELKNHRDSIIALAGQKAIVRQLPDRHKNGIVTVQTSLDVTLKSVFLDGLDQPWEIYIPQW